ncbi:hypothetical protein FOH38_17770 [Lysinibacillus fusiformis]|nr:hypothetical protein FOH38_17770 [Lysinibacillus fusiformis]
MLLSATLPHFAHAQTDDNTNAFVVSNEEAVQTLENSVQIEKEVITDNNTLVVTSLKTDELEATSDINFNLETSEISVDTTLVDNLGNSISNQFEVHFLHIQGEDFKAIFVDQETGEEIYVSTDEVQASIAPLVVVLATVARYGLTRAIAKHGATRVAQATASNALKTKLPTDTVARELAAELGYVATKQSSAGAKIFFRSAKDTVKGPQYIVRDTTSHKGGVWKGATKIENIGSSKTRSGTYDAVLTRIAD